MTKEIEPCPYCGGGNDKIILHPFSGGVWREVFTGMCDTFIKESYKGGSVFDSMDAVIDLLNSAKRQRPPCMTHADEALAAIENNQPNP